MALKDLMNNLAVRESVRPAVHAATVTGESVDTLGFDSVLAVVAVGAIAGAGNTTTKMQATDNADGTTAMADVTADDLEGSFPAVLLTNTVISVGYRGAKRFVRLVSTLNSGTSVAHSGAVVLGHPHLSPTA